MAFVSPLTSSYSLRSPISYCRHDSKTSEGPVRRSIRPRATLSEPASTEPKITGGGLTPTSDQFVRYDGRSLSAFIEFASRPGVRMIPTWQKVFSDQITPVLAYRCLISEDDLETSSFLLETVYTPDQAGRYSIIGANPVCEVVAYALDLTISTHDHQNRHKVDHRHLTTDDPWKIVSEMSDKFNAVIPPEMPGGSKVFNGGWVGFGGYDTMRYEELKSLPFERAPNDDRDLPDLHIALYRDLVLFDHVTKLAYVIHWIDLHHPTSSPSVSTGILSPCHLEQIHTTAMKHLDAQVDIMMRATPLSPMAPARVSINTDAAAASAICESNMTKEQFTEALQKIHHHICVGDTFQTVFSQRFQRTSSVQPFDVYRSLRILNPSPYMIYMQCRGCVIVASSPEILTRVVDGVLTNRPLAGTRRRGTTPEEDDSLSRELLADGKDRSEHMMLVDLGRNDVGKVSEYGTVNPERVMEVERYSHVMHISSTITGKLRKGLTSWDALRATLPAGTISGAPKIRAMQIIDDLEPTKRGPYGGGIGYVSFCDTMNMALALRTIVVPSKPQYDENGTKQWIYYLQAGAGIVFESDPEAEYRETVNKAMALNRSIDLAEHAFKKP